MIGVGGLDPSPKSPQFGGGGRVGITAGSPPGTLVVLGLPKWREKGSVGRVSACSGWARRGPGAGSPPLEPLGDS